MNAHLTQNQLFALLESRGVPSNAVASFEVAEYQSHLATCIPCRAEFTELSESLANFRVAATNLSALYAPTRLLEPTVHRARLFTIPRAAWAGGLVAAMALCTVSINVLHKPAVPSAPTVQTETATAADPDDALLDSIDADLSTSVAPSLQPLAVAASGEKSTLSKK